jgi:hypothetical protein
MKDEVGKKATDVFIETSLGEELEKLELSESAEAEESVVER